MFQKNKLTLALSAAASVLAGASSCATFAQNVKVDINANVEHAVNGVSNFGRERRIMIHANSIENDFLGEKEKLDYLMELGVNFGRDTGLPMYYFRQTKGDKSQSTPPGQELFPYGYADVHDSDSLKSGADGYFYLLENKYEDSQAYFDRDSAMIMGSQPKPAFPNWSSYSWFGGGLQSDTPWRPRTMKQAADWYAEFLEEFYIKREGTVNAPSMPAYWEVVNEPDMQLNTTGPEGHLSTWEELFDYHNEVADTVRAKLGTKAPKIGGMTWGLHDLHAGDATAFGSPRLKGNALLNAFYGNDPVSVQIKDTIRNGIFADSATMADTNTNRNWYQWDVLWKGFMDAAGKNMDFYSIHLYDWPLWNTAGGSVRTGLHNEGVMDLLEWYDTKMLDQRNEVIVSEYGSVTGKYQQEGTTIDRIRMRWEKLKPFSQMMMQFMERPDYITASLPFITVKAEWGDAGLTAPYAQTLLDRDYSTCDVQGQQYVNCTWNFNPAIHWYELWRDIEGTRIDTYSTDRDIQVDAYVKNANNEHHMYVILNSLEPSETTVDLALAGISNNPIRSIKMRHLYLDENIDADNNLANGKGKPIMAEATLSSIPKSITIAPEATVILDIEYKKALNPNKLSQERKYPAEPLVAAAPHRVSVPSVLRARVNGVPKPAKGEAQLRVTGAFFLNGQLTADTSDSRVYLKINGNDVSFDPDWRGIDNRGQNRQMATLEIPFPVSYLNNNGNNNVEFSMLANGDVAAVSIQVWDMEQQLVRSVEANCNPCIPVSGFSITGSHSANLKVTQSKALATQFSPQLASNKRVNWVSSNPSIVSVDQNGIITGTGVGNATITARTVDGNIQDQVTVSVAKLRPNSVSIVGIPSTFYVGATKQLSAAVRPIHAENRRVQWSSSNPAIASVDANGIVTAVKAGNVTITARTLDGGLVATENLTVSLLAVNAFSVTPSDTIIPVGDDFTVNTLFEPANASDQSVTWQSSNPNVATVSNGVITAVNAGTATITATSNASGLSDTVTVTAVNVTHAPIIVEAESFIRTGGLFGGFVRSATGINDNQTGDWGEYNVTFSQSGTYQFFIDTGTPANGGIVELSINGDLVASGGIPNTGNWDTMARTVISNNIRIPTAGSYTIRLTGAGQPAAWVWNSDKFGFTKLTN
ncbi:hypothetical protein CBF23_013010 [Marinomonas agarivorans]|nr:hypothetical protein CBF23_013010 [Marinomonas agarivorans]